MVTSLVACEAIWMKNLLVGISRYRMEPTMIHCDNQSCIKLYKNPMFHDCSNHIKITYHDLRDCVLKGTLKLRYIPTKEKIANILTKALERSRFVHHRDNLGVVHNPFLAKREC